MLIPLIIEFSVFMPFRVYSTREQLVRVRFFEGLQNYMEENEGNENKKILRDFNYTTDKKGRDDEIKQRFLRPCSNYVL